MNNSYTLFAVIKLLFILTIFVELATLQALISPDNAREYIHIILSRTVYIEHIILSIVFLGGGALILLKKLWFLCKMNKNKNEASEYSPSFWIIFCQVGKWKFIFFYSYIFGKCGNCHVIFNFSTCRICGKVEILTFPPLKNQEFCTFSTEFSTL